MNLMDWDLCKKKFVREVEQDKEQLASLLETSDSRFNFLSKQEVTKNNVSFIIEGYYEVVKELLIALLLKNGMRSRNHQCLISFFYNKYPNYEAETHLISNLNYLRNRLNYYGEKIDIEYYEKNKSEIKNTIKILKKLFLKPL